MNSWRNLDKVMMMMMMMMIIIIIIIELDKIDDILPKLDRYFTSSLLLELNYHGMYFSLFSKSENAFG